MAHDFVPMRVIVKGKEEKAYAFLPEGNYITINGVDSPLSHCGTLKMPLGYCDVMVHTPPPYTNYHVEATAEVNQLYYLELELDSRRNITRASFASETITEDPFGLYEHDFKQANEYYPKIEAWRMTHVPAVEPNAGPVPESCTAPKRKGGKLIGWGLVIALFFAAGIIGCHTGGIEIEYIELTNDFQLPSLAIYYGGAVLGLLMFIGGLFRRSNS